MKIGFIADSHLGYQARCRTHPQSGLNMRVRDGYQALAERVTQMIDSEVDLVIDGGDLFHKSWPNVFDIVWARKQLDRLVAAGIPVVGNTGNHDASAERGKLPATATVNDPDKHVDFVVEPYRALHPIDGLTVHVVSHYGLAQTERLIPEPVEGDINIFTTHGAAMVPGHDAFLCVDSPGEQAIGLDLLVDDRYAVKLLGHYHAMGEILDNVWYAGSAVRRGFSDPAGGRGWLEVNIDSSGNTTVTPRHIHQRPQYDLPVIDAAHLTGEDVCEQILGHLGGVDCGDAIVRQVVTNCSHSVRRGVDQTMVKNAADETLMWMLDFRRPTIPVDVDDSAAGSVGPVGLSTAGTADLPALYGGWVGGWAEQSGIANSLIPTVTCEGDRHLREASTNVETEADFVAPEESVTA